MRSIRKILATIKRPGVGQAMLRNTAQRAAGLGV